MKTKFTLQLLLLFVFSSHLLGQNIIFQKPLSVDNDGNDPHANAILDLQSTDKGVLIPRMTTAQRSAIGGGNPAEALLVYDSDTNSFWYFDGNSWQEINFDSSWDYYYLDDDGDTYGNIIAGVYTNNPLPNYVQDHSDCDDSDLNINPDATEDCNGLDDDCDGSIDDNLTPPLNSMQAGACSGSVQTCDGINGWVDDYSGVSNYEAVEVSCDGIDNDCDGEVDEGLLTTFFRDADMDGYGDASDMMQACSAPAGYVSVGGDCDDSQPGINPGATEDCNGLDDDCDGSIDNSLTPPLNSMQAGVCSGSVQICDGVNGWVEDYSGLSSYEAVEVTCDGIDNDCDGLVDEPFNFNSDASNCGGCGISCDDGLDCTTDLCNAGLCQNVIDAGHCVIAGVCYTDGDTNPANFCQECNSSSSQTSWSNKATGTPCDEGTGTCNGNGACVSSTIKGD